MVSTKRPKTMNEFVAEEREIRFNCSAPCAKGKVEAGLRTCMTLKMKKKVGSYTEPPAQQGKKWEAPLMTNTTEVLGNRSSIPVPVAIMSLLFLPPSDLRQCALVCKDWLVALRDDPILSKTLPAFDWSGTDYDEEGIVFYYGTLFGTRDVWTNPAKAVMSPMTVHASSTLKDRYCGPLSQLVHRTVGSFSTNYYPYSWVAVDFGEHFGVSPTHYTLGTSTELTSYPVSWQLFGCRVPPADTSDMDIWLSWELIDEVKNFSFSTTILSSTFPVDVPPITPYRFLRIVQTSLNQQYGHALVVSGLEFYGHLVKKKKIV